MSAPVKIICHYCGQKLDVTDIAPFTHITCPVCDTDLIVPKPFGNLLLEEDMGKGRMAQVFRAMDVTLDREMAVKVLNEELMADSNLANRFLSEARSASAINHPNVIPIYSCGDMEEKTYITMQFMEGGSVLSQLKNGPCKERDAARWFCETARGLESAYIHGVLHNNVKPSNIFLDLDANVKVSDFGLSRVLENNEPLLRNGQAADWVSLEMSYYLSPERISTGKQDMAGDIYSLGASLYHVLTGKPPYDQGTPTENLKARFNAAPKSPKKIREDISEEINELLVSMLSVYPSERPRSYAEVCDVLEDLAGDKPKTEPPTEMDPGKTVPSQDRRPVVRSDKMKPGQRRDKKIISMNRKAEEVPASPYVAEPEEPMHPIIRMLRLLPLVIIAVIAILAVAHYRRFAWYRTHVQPVIERVLGLTDEETEDPGDKPDAEDDSIGGAEAEGDSGLLP